jgi:hypothetical protein
MKKLMFALVVCLATTQIFAQAQEPTDVSIMPKIRKNEIGLLASPVGIVLLGGSPSGQRIGISYKRNSGKKYLFTSGIYYQGFQNNYAGRDITLQIDGKKRNIQSMQSKSGKGSVSLGLERRWAMKTIPALTKFVGAEITFGYGFKDEAVFRQWWELDSLSTEIRPGQEYLVPTGTPNLVYQHLTTTLSTGIALNAGLQLRINNRFYAMAQFSMEMGLGFNDTNEHNHLTGESKNYKATVFDFNQRGLIGDIGLYYRF